MLLCINSSQKRELEIYNLSQQGKYYKEIAFELGIAEQTVRNTAHRIRFKMGISPGRILRACKGLSVPSTEPQPAAAGLALPSTASETSTSLSENSSK